MTTTENKPRFFTDVERVVTPLRTALRGVVGDPAHLGTAATGTRLNPTLRSRLTRGLESDHLPSVLYHLPGPAGLRRLLNVLKQSGADPEALKECRRCIDEYESFLRRENISRDGLHAMVGDLSPDAHTAVVRNNGQAVHKAMTNLIGYAADVMLATLILFPGRTPRRCSLAQVRGFSDLQRRRTGAWFMTSGYAKTSGDTVRPLTLDGKAVDEHGPSTLLDRYCSDPKPHFELRDTGRRKVYQLMEHEIGERSASTFYFGELIPDAYPDPPEVPLIAGDDDSNPNNAPRRAMISSITATPAKRLQLDVLLHERIWQEAHVSLDTFRTVPHGPVDESTVEDREIDRIDLGARMQQMNAASGSFSASHVTGYGTMIADALRRLNVSPESFRVYRCEVVYPLYGTQFAFRFEQPQ